jgi:serine/threonine protein kinase
MVYLHEKGIVHRDLALRNLLVDKTGTKYIVKISDFGMARTMNKGYYKTESKTIPVRWCSPESLQFGKFTIHSDVWAFGVVMWEIFSYGMIPYYGLSNIEVIEKVTIEGYRLPSPANCPEEIYQWMLDCWNNEAVQRPSFQQLYERIEKKWVQAIQNQLGERIPNANQVNNNSSKILYSYNEQ